MAKLLNFGPCSSFRCGAGVSDLSVKCTFSLFYSDDWRREPEMASTVSERIELAKLCTSKDWSKAIRILDNLLAQSCAIQDIWSVPVYQTPYMQLLTSSFCTMFQLIVYNRNFFFSVGKKKFDLFCEFLVVVVIGLSAIVNWSFTNTWLKIAIRPFSLILLFFKPTFSKVIDFLIIYFFFS